MCDFQTWSQAAVKKGLIISQRTTDWIKGKSTDKTSRPPPSQWLFVPLGSLGSRGPPHDGGPGLKVVVWAIKNHWGALLTCLTSSKLFTHIHITLLTFLVAKWGCAGKSFVDAFARLGSWKLRSLQSAKLAEINLFRTAKRNRFSKKNQWNKKITWNNSNHTSHGIT